MPIKKVSSAERVFSDDEIRGFYDLITEPEQRLMDPGDEMLDLEGIFVFFREILPSRPNQAIFLAKEGETVTGMCALFVHTEQEETGEGKIGFGVRSAWTGRGIARTLIETALAHAKARGLGRIVAEAYPHNLRAIHLLTRAGFTIVTPDEPSPEPVTLAVFEKHIV